MLLVSHKHIKTLDHNEAIRSYSRHEFLKFNRIDTCENIQLLGTQLTINHFFLISKFKYKNLNCFSLLSKIEEHRSIAKSANAAVIGISESKLGASVL